MYKDKRNFKYCNCNISSNKNILKENVNFSFCEKCGSILLKDPEDNIYYTLKSKKNHFHYELNIINIIKHMKEKTEENFPNIYEEFNINRFDKDEKEMEIKSINIYFKHRKKFLLKLQKLIRKFDFCDLIFYQCLYYLDTFLSHDITEDFSEKKSTYFLIGYFLCSLKFHNVDINEPSFDTFFDIFKGMYLSSEKIAEYEIVCLKRIKYNIFCYSTYDWITNLISNGIVFNCEIDDKHEIIMINGHRHSLIKAINKYVLKSLINLTSRKLFFKYSPMYTAISLIQLAREKYLDKKLINQKLFFRLINLYDIEFEDYKICYEEIKANLDDNNSDKNKTNIDKTKTNKNDDEIKEEQEKNIEELKSDKNISIFSKNKSSRTIRDVKHSSNIYNLRYDYDDNNEKEKDIELTLKEVESNVKSTVMQSPNNNLRKLNHLGHISIDCNTNFIRIDNNLQKSKIKNRHRLSIISKNENKLKSHSFIKNKVKPIVKEIQHITINVRESFKSKDSSKTDLNSNLKTIFTNESNKKKEKKEVKFLITDKIINDILNDNELTKKNSQSAKKRPKLSDVDKLLKDKLKVNSICRSGKRQRIINNKNMEIQINLPDEEIKNS